MSTDTMFVADPIKSNAPKSRTYGVRFALCMLAASLVLAGCGGGGEDSSAATSNPGGGATGGGSTGGGSTGGGSTGGGSTGGGSTGGGSTGGGGSPPPVTGSATLTWLPPTQKTDGSPLNDLAGYKVYWGQNNGSLTNVQTVNTPGVSSYVINQLGQGTWYFVVTAVDSTGVESSFSNVASKTI